ncbi:ABC transporter ATP-binding protein [Vibrio quintilis]|uniref:Glutathione import ATP-binding protein GsiA n=1 Tax=Vibrio quintilis TaxID=1117707 RepID=A0A1M7YTK5_9VIBR|nr:ABC transporter ATP-binding protein [Vibrio quintilis]SHO55983.1 Glutathione import ATP-binding protein GsiA [Vibrio quintilis]
MRDFIEVKGLCISAEQDHGPVQIVNDVSFSLEKGKVLALIGESGSGKTTIALSLMGYTKPGCAFTQGEVWLGDDNLLTASPAQLCNWRGKRVTYIAQSAAAAFNPGKRLIDQVIESALLHNAGTRNQLIAKAIKLFRELALPEPEEIGQRYPHEVSGGQLQRIMAAMALIAEPELVILDEPTTALDVTTQVEVLQVFRKVVQQRQVTAVYVSHDLAVVAQVADKVVVLNHGEIKETNDIETILHAPAHPYTQELMQAASPVQNNGSVVLATASDKSEPKKEPLLSVRKLVAGYGRRNKMGIPEFPVLDDIRFKLWPGQAIGIIGESGSGKSTLAKTLVGMLPAALGNIKYQGSELPPKLSQRSKEQCRKIQLVFQSADTALNPKHTVRQLLGRPLKTYFKLSGQARNARIEELIRLVQLPKDIIDRKPSALSGGQKQRVNLARALAAEPDIIICDEVTSALDTVVGAAILELLNDLKDRLGFAYLFISHDMNSVKSLCDDVIVLYKGTQVQSSPVNGLYHGPLHPYTALLMDSVPQLRTRWIHEPRIATQPTGTKAASGQQEICAFVERCSRSIAGLCPNVAPSRRAIQRHSHILCHLQDDKLPTLATLTASAQDAADQGNVHPLAKQNNKEQYA